MVFDSVTHELRNMSTFTHGLPAAITTMAEPRGSSTLLRMASPPMLQKSASPSASRVSIYKGISNRPLGWKARRSASTPTMKPSTRYATRKWDGLGKNSAEWDRLRRDPELWFPDGNCLVHLHAYGQSQRGPAFKVPLAGLRAMSCEPLLDRYLVDDEHQPPMSDSSSTSSTDQVMRDATRQYKLYIPAPANVDRGLYHTATRNFLAWVYGRPLVGIHLGAALVALFNSMNEFRNAAMDNVEAIMEFMAEEGYGDMREQPDHALGILYFAEKFRFRDLWIDAFVHCVGMNERLGTRPGYEYISRQSRSLITRSRMEMDARLESCGRRLGTFLSDDLSNLNTGLSASAHAHLDKFRSFLQAYFVGKLGYYPPTSAMAQKATFPNGTYDYMYAEFETLYEYLMDEKYTSAQPLPVLYYGGICVQQIVEVFDQRHGYEGLPHPLPLLPEFDETTKSKGISRFSILSRNNKMKPDTRLLSVASMSKATNRKERVLNNPLVRAYMNFERDCVFSPLSLFVDKEEKLSQKEARKVRWILIYSILQTLHSVTRIPEEVNDIHNISYNVCVQTTNCPPWKEARPVEASLPAETKKDRDNVEAPLKSTTFDQLLYPPSKKMPKLSYLPSLSLPQTGKPAAPSPTKSPGTVKKARQSLGNMPELQHPQPKRGSIEILAQGYGNGSDIGNFSLNTNAGEHNSHTQELSSESESSSINELSCRWSNNSMEAVDTASPATSVGAESRRGSSASVGTLKDDINAFLNGELDAVDVENVSPRSWDETVDEKMFWRQEPLTIRKRATENQL